MNENNNLTSLKYELGDEFFDKIIDDLHIIMKNNLKQSETVEMRHVLYSIANKISEVIYAIRDGIQHYNE